MKYSLITVVILVAILVGAPRVFAATDVYPQSTYDGSNASPRVDFSTLVPMDVGTTTQVVYYGVYPDTSHILSNNTAPFPSTISRNCGYPVCDTGMKQNATTTDPVWTLWQNTVYGDFYLNFDPLSAPYNDVTTHIVSMTPLNNIETPILNPVTFTLHAYISPNDVGNIIKIKIDLHNIDQNVLLLSDFSNSDLQLYFGLATSTGDFYFSTTTDLAYGNYRFRALLDSCASAVGTCLVQVPLLGIHI